VRRLAFSPRRDPRQALADLGWVSSQDTLPELDICPVHRSKPVVRSAGDTMARGTMVARMVCDSPSGCASVYEQHTVRVATLRARALRAGWREYDRSRTYVTYLVNHCCPGCAAPLGSCPQCPPWDQVSDLIGHDPKGHLISGALRMWFRRDVSAADLAAMSESDLLDVRNIGVGAVERIRGALAGAGLSLSG
jgi:hypothetical protein